MKVLLSIKPEFVQENFLQEKEKNMNIEKLFSQGV